MNILVANDNYPPQMNGAALASQRLVRGLAGRGHRVSVVAPSMSFRDEQQADSLEPEVTVHRIKSFSTKPFHPEFRIPFWARITAKLDRIIQDLEPDIIHLQNHFVVSQASLRLARRYGIPVVGTNHFTPDNLLHYFPRPLRTAGSAVMWRHWLRVYGRLDCIFAPSHACLAMLREAGLTAPAQVVSNGIVLNRYGRRDVPEEIYGKYGIRKGVPIFLSVGRLEKDKKVDLIIRATAAAAAYGEVQTVIAGRGKDEPEFRQLSRELGLDGNVVFTGFVSNDDLAALYSLADVYVGAGFAELQGLAVMEAMAAGLPILAANCLALPELVENGVNGYLFPLTAEGLSAGMLLMLNQRDWWQEMGRNSLAAIQAHDMPKVMSQVEDLYQQMIEQNAAVPVRGAPALRA